MYSDQVWCSGELSHCCRVVHTGQGWQCAHVNVSNNQWHSLSARERPICQDNATSLAELAFHIWKGKGRFYPHCCFQILRLMPWRCPTAPILTSSLRSKPKDLELKLMALWPAKTEEPWSWRNSWWTWVKKSSFWWIFLLNIQLLTHIYITLLLIKWLYKYRCDLQGLCFLSGKEVIFLKMMITFKHTNIFQYINC